MRIEKFEEDLFELQGFCTRLEKFIETEHLFVEGSLVVALSSKFGSGKSSFLTMWQDALGAEEESKYLVIKLNAWESDYIGDPLFSIISALADGVKKAGDPDNQAQGLLNAAKDLGWFASALSSQVVNKFTGLDPVAAGQFAKDKKEEREGDNLSSLDAFSVYLSREKAMRNLKLAINGIVEASSPHVLFLVDELDRCRPDYAITYLETIKHIFDSKGAVFILAVDRDQIENSARTAFGMKLDFDEYFRKFIHREVSLPPISEAGYQNLAQRYTEYYLKSEGNRYSFMELDDVQLERIVSLISGMKLTPRQIQEVFRILGHVMATTEQKQGRLLWCLAVGTIAMAALKVGEKNTYQALAKGKLSPKGVAEFCENLGDSSYPDWWFILFLTGGGINFQKGETEDDIVRKSGLFGDNGELFEGRDLNQWYFGWNHRTNGFSEIFKRIEEISQWT